MTRPDPDTLTPTLYVYYRMRADIDLDDARAQIAAMQATLARRFECQARLMRRLEDPHTWMEVYESVTHYRAFEVALAEAVSAAALDTLVEPGSARHLEHFVALDETTPLG